MIFKNLMVESVLATPVISMQWNVVYFTGNRWQHSVDVISTALSRERGREALQPESLADDWLIGREIKCFIVLSESERLNCFSANNHFRIFPMINLFFCVFTFKVSLNRFVVEIHLQKCYTHGNLTETFS